MISTINAVINVDNTCNLKLTFKRQVAEQFKVPSTI